LRIYPLFLPHAGCLHRCVFCRQEGRDGVRVPDPDEAARQFDAMLPAAGAGEIAFYGGSFSLLAEALQRGYLQRAQAFVREGRASGIRISTRPDALCEGAIGLLKAEGVTTVEIGCQSFCDKVLLLSQRGHGADDASGAVERLRRFGLGVGLQLMPGLPGGGRREGLRSLKAALDLSPDFMRIYPALIFRGTHLESMWRSGSYLPLALEEAVELCADLLLLCRRASVPVIRLGLQSTPLLEESFLAGPWHPAFGQLVRSRLWRRALAAIAESAEMHAGVEIHPADLAEALGHRRENAIWLRERFGAFNLLLDTAIDRNEIRCGSERFSVDALAVR
jgi:histone acetyltransferase (RNA polymerase elongator complex component)